MGGWLGGAETWTPAFAGVTGLVFLAQEDAELSRARKRAPLLEFL